VDSKPNWNEYGKEIENNKIPEDLGDYVAHVFGYNSKSALDFSSQNFALVSEFVWPAYEIQENHMIFDGVKQDKKTILNMVFDFYKLRNMSTHELEDYSPEKALQIQANLENIIEIITGIFSQALDIRRLNVDDNDWKNSKFKHLRKKIIEEQISWCNVTLLNIEHGKYFSSSLHKYPNTKSTVIKQFEKMGEKLKKTKRVLQNA
jgi:hypothetical protein